MDKHLRQLVFMAAIVAMSTIARSQALDSTLAHYNRNYQPEKVWLHYDKDVYQAGETIWFKAYLMDGLFPAQQTKTIYIDWVGDNGEVLAHTVSPVVEGTSNGQLDIPDNYTGNFIHVKSYTKWMLNFDSSFIYSKDIRILNKNISAKTNSTASITTVDFFPEGGDAIAGISNRVAFKAADQYGLPVNIRGAIEDNKGTLIDSFRTKHDGMGSFIFTPIAGTIYLAKWKDGKGISHTSELPPVKTSGASLQVVISEKKRIVTIQSNAVEDKFKMLHLVGTMNGGIAFKSEVNLVATKISRKVIPTENLPSGILTITVFDADWNAIAERITFIDNGDYSFATSLEVVHWGLNKRAQNDIRLNVPAGLQGANLSVSITDAGIEADSSSSIITHFLLTGDLKGYVHNPSYYFSSKADSVLNNLDLVMLTHGWRRFKWEDITKGKLPEIQQPRDTSYLSLSGKVYGVTKSQLSGKESIFLFLTQKDSATQTVLTPINRDGSFKEPDFIFFDTLKVYYQLKSKLFSSAEAKFMTDRLSTPNYLSASKNFIKFKPTNDTSGFYRHTLLAAELVRLQRMQKGKLMENITVTAKSKPLLKQMDEKYTKGLFSGGDGYQFDLANDPMALGQMNVFNYLQGKVAGLQINSTGSTPTLSWRGGSPQLFLDEMPIDAEFLNTIPVSDIAFVKVFRPPFMGGFNGSGGAIAVYTRKGDDTRSKPGGLNTNTIIGYTPIREFYSPNYSRFDKRNEQPDVRTTLYWNPLVLVRPNNTSVQLQFYNNDVSKAFRVVIEGISKEGLVTHHEEVIE
ncbi:hypothetical protein [Flavisolibacter ginsengisoli]|jgi:hypothetical protein|uniref:MG2 domain-containing protein n=1 Tax=Flavisolibacter ginsengisoli DSM 18119 TaxID=1121884 RepID=A0A1M4VD59_9BACT|nr:hypothetical protein [Flavisolibacter ginsengisoli]SHE66837.1 hypothetical protein SAMN02745131_00817 [Flavisolibacter ginsengisoli DSM 18119]